MLHLPLINVKGKMDTKSRCLLFSFYFYSVHVFYKCQEIILNQVVLYC